MWPMLGHFGDTPAEAVAAVATCPHTDRTPAEVVELLRFWIDEGHITTADIGEAAALASDAFEHGPNRTRDEMGLAVVVLSRVLR